MKLNETVCILMQVSPWSRSVHSGRRDNCWCPEGEWAEPLRGCGELEAEPNNQSEPPSWLQQGRVRVRYTARPSYMDHLCQCEIWILSSFMVYVQFINLSFKSYCGIETIDNDDMINKPKEAFGSWIVLHKDVYRPAAVCRSAPSSAGITKCETFTTSLFNSSCKSYRGF